MNEKNCPFCKAIIPSKRSDGTDLICCYTCYKNFTIALIRYTIKKMNKGTKMHIIKRSEKIKNVAKRWKEQYYKNDCWYDIRKEKIHKELIALDLNNVDADTVNGIIGNNSWINLPCYECGGKNLKYVVMVGEPMDYESYTTSLCFDCIDKLNVFIAPYKSILFRKF